AAVEHAIVPINSNMNLLNIMALYKIPPPHKALNNNLLQASPVELIPQPCPTHPPLDFMTNIL
ncbi:hypothetical protein ACFL02_02490, partial [Planctomycetota bacterium]